MFEFRPNRFVDVSRVVTADIYQKQSDTPNDKGEYPPIIRVSMSLDVADTKAATIYSDPMPSTDKAKEFINKLFAAKKG